MLTDAEQAVPERGTVQIGISLRSRNADALFLLTQAMLLHASTGDAHPQ
jgi:hypothetical protein